MIARRLTDDGCDVRIVDPALSGQGGAAGHSCDISAMSQEVVADLGRAEVVVLAVPESVALAALPSVAAAMAPGALLMNTLSVQGEIGLAGGPHADHLELLGINPMFAPSLDPKGRAVAAVVVRDGPRVQAMLDVVAGWGARVVRVSADEHDRLAAATQGLTHATVLVFGLALTQMLGTTHDIAALAAIAPPPHATLLALLARIVGGTPEVYWDVQSGNPHAESAREALAAGVRRLADLINAGQPAFTRGLLELRGLLGAHFEPYRDHCKALFSLAPPVDPPRIPDERPYAPRTA
jgi:prephenate dehydrogenase